MRRGRSPFEPPPPSPAERVRAAVGSLRIVGTVFVAIGGGLGLLAARTHDVPLGAAAAVLLVGPGVLYHVTGFLISNHREPRVALLARRTAFAQSAVAGGGTVAFVAVGGFGRTGAPTVLVPAVVTLFFVPALLAQAWEIGVALTALLLLPDAQRGFAVEPLAVLPVPADDAADDAAVDRPEGGRADALDG